MKKKEIKNINKEENDKRIKELRLELVKAKINTGKAGSSKVKEIKRIMARLITLNKSKEEPSKGGKEKLKNK